MHQQHHRRITRTLVDEGDAQAADLDMLRPVREVR